MAGTTFAGNGSRDAPSGAENYASEYPYSGFARVWDIAFIRAGIGWPGFLDAQEERFLVAYSPP